MPHATTPTIFGSTNHAAARARARGAIRSACGLRAIGRYRAAIRLWDAISPTSPASRDAGFAADEPCAANHNREQSVLRYASTRYPLLASIATQYRLDGSIL